MGERSGCCSCKGAERLVCMNEEEEFESLLQELLKDLLNLLKLVIWVMVTQKIGICNIVKFTKPRARLSHSRSV